MPVTWFELASTTRLTPARTAPSNVATVAARLFSLTSLQGVSTLGFAASSTTAPAPSKAASIRPTWRTSATRSTPGPGTWSIVRSE